MALNTSREAVLLAALGEIDEAVEVIDPQDMVYLHVNAAFARLHGLALEVILQKGLPWVVARWHTATLAELRQIYRQCVQQQPAPTRQLHDVPTEGGGSRWIEVTSRAVKVEGQWLIVSVSRDTTHARAREQRLQMLDAVLNDSPDSMVVIDPQALEFLEINNAAASLHGHSREDLLRRGLDRQREELGLWSREDLHGRYRALIDNYPLTTSERFPWPGGRTIESRRRAVRLEEQWLIVSVLRDVTDRRAAERKIQQLYAAVNQAPDAIMIVDPVRLAFIDVNEGCARMFGLSRPALLRLGLRGLQGMGAIDPEHVLRERYEALIASHPQAQTETGELRVPGRPVAVLETTQRAVNVEGRWVVITVSRDVTERKGVEGRAQRLKAAIDQAVDAIFVIDPDTMTYVDVNESGARLYGTTREQLLDTNVESLTARLDLYPADTMRERLQALIAQAPQPTVENLTLRFPDGRTTIVETTRRAMQIDGKWLVLVISRDVTEREKASQELAAHAAELARSNRELEQFASVTSHDLSEPLRMVASFTQLLARRYGAQLDDEGREFMGYIVSGAQRMKQLIDDLLVYSRAGRAGAQMASQSLDLALDDALDNLAHAVLDTDAVIERATPMPILLYERTGMTQVFQNLVSNALKFRRGKPPVVTIAAQRCEGDWTISVMDNGIGVDPDYFDRIFVIFQRLHSREEYEGTGIGLAICEKIVERHGGRIWAEAAPSGGACFKFTLPACAKAAAAAPGG